MTTLRALVGACSMVAFMGLVVSVPLAWTFVLGIAAISPETMVQGPRYQHNDDVVKKRVRPHATYK